MSLSVSASHRRAHPDKFAASKHKAIWMGGIPPLGYDVKDRHLVPNDSDKDQPGDSAGLVSDRRPP